jgi:hypothetical protein
VTEESRGDNNIYINKNKIKQNKKKKEIKDYNT